MTTSCLQSARRWPRLLAWAVIVLLGSLTVASGAPLPKTPPPQGNEVAGLTLRLEAEEQFEFGKPWKAKLTLSNSGKRRWVVANLAAANGELRNSQGLSYVVRFANGKVYEVGGGWDGTPIPASGSIKIKRRPVIVPAGQSVSSAMDLNRYISKSGDFLEEWSRCKQFCVTAIVDGMSLKSNTVYVNGFPGVPKGYDPFKDAEDYRKWKEIEQHRRNKGTNRGG